ncbi:MULTISPECIES: alpha/beta hydrolase [unclassified Herbaspirillum]|uniref:alpha/beta fold hydrolase n=1 Tax=unclassified Herbaspirillum TaxID=2624150 RepID=UPI000E2F43CD|nr:MULTISPECIES: alpha/beta hydrolase [unclassified Herbaspirillum]RFB73303.1 alpha/beta hydrolase [Herbaspirillum sp. 3R-3a1]TFI10891.1 alpha/beta hydrolase [Herbaspirillum sp. 3R11]TFI16799.1 alpha/beta hydrolase [Herbaspirillum sp. 3R-11]TFI26081.1 alpha/beta hydrolase [Herbaspirillum sp. 3C11]
MRPWILLRGLMRETRHWGEFPQVLATYLPTAEIVMLDLPGNGSLHLRRSPDYVHHMVEACRGQLQERGIAPPYNLLALSLGAMVACDWATCHPDEIEKAVLINTSLRPFSPFYQRLRPRNYATLLRLAIGADDDTWRERTILRLTSNRHPPARLLSEWMRYLREQPVTRANALRQLSAAMRYEAPPQAPATDLLVLCGMGDKLVNPHCSRKLAQQWQAPLRAHDSAGHDLTLDEPDWVAQQVREWLSDGDAS